jgi:cell division protein FtsA
MYKGNVAILDIGSSKITALVGERGINNTFIFKAIKTVFYSGFENGVFFDLEELTKAIKSVIIAVESNCKIKIKEIYIGVPGEFVLIKTKKHIIAFSKKKKINNKDILRLNTDSFDFVVKGYTNIKTTAIYYVLSDKTRTVIPEKYISDTLEGYLSYFLCSDKFIKTFENILNGLKITKIKYLPVSLAEATYLIPSEIRDEISLLADIGYISSTVSVIGGNGIIYQKSFSRGGGYISAYLSEGLDIDFDTAELIKHKVNMSYNVSSNDVYEIYQGEELLSFSAKQVNEIIGYGLDEICEFINVCLEGYGSKEIETKILNITGEGLYLIRGSYEYISKRLNLMIESLAPKIPYFNKPSQSSVLSLLDMALNENKTTFFKKLFN